MEKPLNPGTSWVAAQFALLTLAAAGGLLALWSVQTLGRSLTPLPKPKDDAVLVVRGPYRWVRHPIYSALVLATAAWGLFWKDPVILGLDGLLVVVFLFKTRLEERWLVGRYPDYEAYRRRTGRLFPKLF
jgi:protein-S-isoprenylcysteine O-methyltransferase Ste14